VILNQRFLRYAEKQAGRQTDRPTKAESINENAHCAVCRHCNVTSVSNVAYFVLFFVLFSEKVFFVIFSTFVERIFPTNYALLMAYFLLVTVGDVSTRLAIQTLEEMEWCLEQLDKMQTHRSVADMATNKVFQAIYLLHLARPASRCRRRAYDLPI